MNADVTITISTAAGGTVDTARPVPALGGDASVTEAAGHASGPVPLPLDQLPTGSAGVSDSSKRREPAGCRSPRRWSRWGRPPGAPASVLRRRRRWTWAR